MESKSKKENWLRWNCDFCYPSHAKSTFSLSRTPPKMTQNRIKKKSATRPPKNPQFSTSGRLWMATWTEKASKRFLLGGPGAFQKRHFCCPKLSWGQDGPQESPSLDFGSSSDQLWFIFKCFRKFFYRLASFLSAPAVGRGSNRKQPTAHSKLNDGAVTNTFDD